MRKKINLVILLMSLCTLFLMGLQLYWNYQSYRSNSRVFKSDINDALNKAVNSQMNSKRDSFTLLYEKWLADTSLITIGVRYSDSMKANIFNIKDTHPPFNDRKPFSIGLHEFKLPVRAFTPEIKKRFIRNFAKGPIANDLRSGSAYFHTQRLGDSMVAAFNRDRLDMTLLKTTYRKELAERDIESAFELHTASYSFKSFSADAVKTSDKLNATRTFKYGFSPPMIVVSAYFPQPNLIFLQKMRWVLLASLALIGITIACFTYTVRTMLSQKRLSELKDDFVNNMTHELKTPVATISIAAEAIQDFKVNAATAEEYLGIIRYQSASITHLIDQLLKSMLNERHVSAIRQVRLSLTDMLRQCLQQYQPQLIANKARLAVELDDPEIFVNGDGSHLGNVVANLLDNAIKYSERPPVIAVALTAQNNRALLCISNAGPAIPAEYRDKVFERFFRVPAGNTHDVKGYGLGLSYVKEIVRQHGGRIDLRYENELNIFTIYLPLA